MQQSIAPEVLKVNDRTSTCECNEGAMCTYCILSFLEGKPKTCNEFLVLFQFLFSGVNPFLNPLADTRIVRGYLGAIAFEAFLNIAEIITKIIQKSFLIIVVSHV